MRLLQCLNRDFYIYSLPHLPQCEVTLMRLGNKAVFSMAGKIQFLENFSSVVTMMMWKLKAFFDNKIEIFRQSFLYLTFFFQSGIQSKSATKLKIVILQMIYNNDRISYFNFDYYYFSYHHLFYL